MAFALCAKLYDHGGAGSVWEYLGVVGGVVIGAVLLLSAKLPRATYTDASGNIQYYGHGHDEDDNKKDDIFF